jgi:hypothetical protein
MESTVTLSNREQTNKKSKPRYKNLLSHHSAKLADSKAGADGNLVEMVEALQAVDTDSQLAELNETSIADNNGGRILL